jgi:histidine ammonia-lyase
MESKDTVITLDGESLNPQDIELVAKGAKVQIAPGAREAVIRAHAAIAKLVEDGEVIYGVTTGSKMFYFH